MTRPKPEELKRPAPVRDSRCYYIACEDKYASPNYFTHLKDMVRCSRINIIIIPSLDGMSSPKHVLSNLSDGTEGNYQDGDVFWMLIDLDHNNHESHRVSFIETQKEAKHSGVCVAISRPCFEFWLLLHHLNTENEKLLSLSNGRESKELLKETIGEYGPKCNIRYDDFSADKVRKAIIGAIQIDSTVSGGWIPDSNTSRVYQLVMSIIDNSSPENIPEEFLVFKQESEYRNMIRKIHFYETTQQVPSS